MCSLPNIQPAQRLELVQEYYFSRKLKEVAQMNAQGLNVISLGIGSPDLPPSPQTIATLCQVAQLDNTHGYQPTQGTPELRKAIAKFYRRWFGVEFDEHSEVLPLIGSKEGILHTTLAFVNPGEKVLVPNPGYPTYTSLSLLLGAQVVPYDLLHEQEWQPDFEQLESMDTTGVKLMWINYPNMPTGAKAKLSTYRRLIDFARQRGIVIVNDNPYSFILGKERHSIFQIEGAKECCIEFNSMSKSHNMPGWRVGMLVAKSYFCQWILKVKSNIDSGMFRAIQLAAASAIDNDDLWHEQHNIEVYTRRRTIAESIMRALGCHYDRKQVGMFLWGRIPEELPDCESLTERVLHEGRVFITPGFIFGSNGSRYIRLSLCANEKQLQEALQRIEKMNFSPQTNY